MPTLEIALSQRQRYLANILIAALRRDDWRATSNPPATGAPMRDSVSYVWRTQQPNTPRVLRVAVPFEILPNGEEVALRELSLHETEYRRAMLHILSERLCCKDCHFRPFQKPFTTHKNCVYSQLMCETTNLYRRQNDGFYLNNRKGKTYVEKHEQVAQLLLEGVRTA